MAVVDLDLRVQKATISNTQHLRLRSADSLNTSLVDHKISLSVTSSLDKDTRTSMHSNEVIMFETNRATVQPAVRCHRVLTLRLEATVSRTRLRTTGCHRKHTQLAPSSLTTEDNRMSASELFRLLKLRRHTRDHNRLHNRLLCQRLNLHVPMCPRRNLSQKPPRTPTSTIRKSHGAQDHRESVRWPIEHQRLLQKQRLFRL